MALSMGSPGKPRWPIICLLTSFALSLSGCAQGVSDFKKARKIDALMNSWVGHYQSELIASWGPPTRVVPDEEGGTVLTYESLKGTWGEEKDKRVVGGTHYPTRPRQEGYAATRMFYVNKKGIIHSWKWSGL
ncbi:MAG: hypothetical protein SWH78_01520 [Thermodesulfobacteriota bacterium]|nr:hypothetical protein [Thermodesulfobacteriota bacterium]